MQQNCNGILIIPPPYNPQEFDQLNMTVTLLKNLDEVIHDDATHGKLNIMLEGKYT
jgi:hypothetical protein